MGSSKSKPTVKPLTYTSFEDQRSVLLKRKTHLEKLIELYDQKANDPTLIDNQAVFLNLKQTYEDELRRILSMCERLTPQN